jgi:hypothetical protein
MEVHERDWSSQSESTPDRQCEDERQVPGGRKFGQNLVKNDTTMYARFSMIYEFSN